ncbi:MAG: hypothetical protein V4487_00080 [Chlamydiota bacterium]
MIPAKSLSGDSSALARGALFVSAGALCCVMPKWLSASDSNQAYLNMGGIVAVGHGLTLIAGVFAESMKEVAKSCAQLQARLSLAPKLSHLDVISANFVGGAAGGAAGAIGLVHPVNGIIYGSSLGNLLIHLYNTPLFFPSKSPGDIEISGAVRVAEIDGDDVDPRNRFDFMKSERQDSVLCKIGDDLYKFTNVCAALEAMKHPVVARAYEGKAPNEAKNFSEQLNANSINPNWKNPEHVFKCMYIAMKSKIENDPAASTCLKHLSMSAIEKQYSAIESKLLLAIKAELNLIPGERQEKRQEERKHFPRDRQNQQPRNNADLFNQIFRGQQQYE